MWLRYAYGFVLSTCNYSLAHVETYFFIATFQQKVMHVHLYPLSEGKGWFVVDRDHLQLYVFKKNFLEAEI